MTASHHFFWESNEKKPSLSSEPQKEFKDRPLFPTKNASDIGYSFAKPLGHFTQEEKEIKIPDNAAYHKAFFVQKVPKKLILQNQKTLSQRNKKSWVKIKNTLVTGNNISRINQMIVTAGEIYRLIIGDTQPKYRIATQNKNNLPISEAVPGYIEFFDYLTQHMKNNKLEGEHYFEGMGRVIFTKFYAYEDDAHFGNFCLNNNSYFVGIDHDRSFAPITNKLRLNDKEKIVNYDISHYKNLSIKKAILTKGCDPQFLLNYPVTFMGESNVIDYDKLPVISYFLPKHWHFKSVPGYAEALSKNLLFTNEKHLSAVKVIVTQSIQHHLIDIHLIDKSDREALHDLITQRNKEIIMMVKNTYDFRKHFYTHYKFIFLAIFYEIRDFLLANKHYRFVDAKADQLQWIDLTRLIINDTKYFSKYFKLKLEWDDFEKSLQRYSEKIYENDIKMLSSLSSFYKHQKMNYYVSKVDAQIAKIQSMEKQEKIPRLII